MRWAPPLNYEIRQITVPWCYFTQCTSGKKEVQRLIIRLQTCLTMEAYRVRQLNSILFLNSCVISFWLVKLGSDGTILFSSSFHSSMYLRNELIFTVLYNSNLLSTARECLECILYISVFVWIDLRYGSIINYMFEAVQLFVGVP